MKKWQILHKEKSCSSHISPAWSKFCYVMLCLYHVYIISKGFEFVSQKIPGRLLDTNILFQHWSVIFEIVSFGSIAKSLALFFHICYWLVLEMCTKLDRLLSSVLQLQLLYLCEHTSQVTLSWIRRIFIND